MKSAPLAWNRNREIFINLNIEQVTNCNPLAIIIYINIFLNLNILRER